MLHDDTDWTIDLRLDDVLRGQGMDPEPVKVRSPRVAQAAEDAIAQGRGFLKPRVVTREYRVLEHEPDGLVLEGGEFRCGEGLAARIAGATRLIVVGATVGDDLLDHAVDVAENQGDPLLALGMQGTGAAAVEDLAVQACRSISLPASEAGESGVLCWPGSAVWPNVEAQQQIFALLRPDGVPAEPKDGELHLDKYGIVRPVTSITFAVAVGAVPEEAAETADARRGAQAPCETCAKIPVCNFAGC